MPHALPEPPVVGPTHAKWHRRCVWAQFFGLAVDPLFVDPAPYSARAAYRGRVDEFNLTAMLMRTPTHEEVFVALRLAGIECGIGFAFDAFIAERERPHPSWAERQRRPS